MNFFILFWKNINAANLVSFARKLIMELTMNHQMSTHSKPWQSNSRSCQCASVFQGAGVQRTLTSLNERVSSSNSDEFGCFEINKM